MTRKILGKTIESLSNDAACGDADRELSGEPGFEHARWLCASEAQGLFRTIIYQLMDSGAAVRSSSPISSSRSLERSHLSSSSTASSTCCGFLRAHSHSIATRQPARRSATRTALSRSTLAENLVRQNSGRVAGFVVKRQPVCRCQKQPCTKTTAPYFGSTRSGRPGMFFACSRYRKPRACNARRSSSSGAVSLPLIPAIIRDRVSLFTTSVMSRLPSCSRVR